MRAEHRDLWWLHPCWPLGGIVGVTLALAFWQSEQAFDLHDTPKYLGKEHLLLGASFLAAFAVGCFWATRLHAGRRFVDARSRSFACNNRVVAMGFWACVGLTIFGYVTWFGVGILHGFSPSLFWELLTTDAPELADQIRSEVFPNVPGVTTCTQFGYAAMAMGLWLYFQCEKKTVLIPMLVIVGLSVVRSVLLSERTALIELAFPLLFISLRLGAMNRPMPKAFWRSMRLAPFVAPLAAVLFFGGFEYFRSWRYFQEDFHSYSEFTVWRLSGYFTTAHNNGAMALETQQVRPLPYVTLQWLWQFPGVPESDFSYEKLTGYEHAGVHEAMLEDFGNAGLNNEGGLFQPLLDWGLPLALVFWCGYGFLSGSAYRNFLDGTFWGVTIYPLILLSLLEVPLVFFLLYTRNAPPLAVLVLVAVVARKMAYSTRVGLPGERNQAECGGVCQT